MHAQDIREGDKEAFEEFYNAHWEKLFLLANSLLRSQDLAKDFTQEAFIRLWQNRSKIDPSLSLLSYLYAILKNSIINYIKREQSFNQKIREVAAMVNRTELSPADILSAKDLEDFICEETRKFPARMRQIWQMSREKHMAAQEIAQVLNISPLTVKKQISNALAILRVRIGTRFKKN